MIGQRQRGDGRREAAEHHRALAADDHQAELRRQRHAQRGQQQRRGALQGVLQENQLPNAPLPDRSKKSADLADQRDEDAEQNERPQQQRAAVTHAPPPARGAVEVGRRARRAAASAAARRADAVPSRSRRADDAFDEVVHRFEFDRGLRVGLAGGDHVVALVVLQRPLKTAKPPFMISAFTASALALARPATTAP